MEYAYDDTSPDIHDSARVCSEATLVGDVAVGPHASVWPGAVLRGDFGPVRVGAHSHVEDNAVLHEATVGAEVLVGHGAVLNSASVGDRNIVGINTTLNADVHVGSKCIVAPNAVIPQGREIPPESIVRGVPGEVIPADEIGQDIEDMLAQYPAKRYSGLAEEHEDLFGPTG